MSMLSLNEPGKHPGKQIREAIAIWGSTPTRRDAKLSGGFVPSLRAADFRTFDALHTPNVAPRPLRFSSNCFPDFAERTGEAKSGPEGPF